jgi:hypothetical protein
MTEFSLGVFISLITFVLISLTSAATSALIFQVLAGVAVGHLSVKLSKTILKRTKNERK